MFNKKRKVLIDHYMTVRDFLKNDGELKKGREIYSRTGNICLGVLEVVEGRVISIFNRNTEDYLYYPDSQCSVKTKATVIVE